MASRISFDRLPGGPRPPMTTVPPRPARPVFVDATGTRRQRIRRAGVLVALASLGYLPMAASALLPGPATPLLPGPVPVGGAPSGGASHPPVLAPSPGPTHQRPAPRSTRVVDPPPAAAAPQRPTRSPRPAPRRVDPAPVDSRPTSPAPTPSPIPSSPDQTPPATPTPPATTGPGTSLSALPGPAPEVVR
ncbi:hypothetical protein [Micromonospora chersina]